MSYFNNSPVFTGNPQAPTPLTTDNSVSIATTAYVKAQGYSTTTGTVTAIGVTTANGVSGSSSGGATPNLTITLGAITPTSVNGLIVTTTAGTLTVANNASASLATTGNFAITLAATAASTVTMPASTSAVLNYYTSAPASANAIPYAGGTSGLLTYLAVNAGAQTGFLSQTSSGSPSWNTSTGTAGTAVVLATSPTITTPTLTTPTINTGGTLASGTLGVSSGAAINIASGATLTVAAGGTLTLTSAPVNPTDAANKAYVDANVQGLSPKPTAALATTGILNATQNYTYNNGVTGVGATLTNAGTLAALVIDSIPALVNQIILVKNEITNPQYNGLYTVTTVGSGAVAWVLTRHPDMDSTAEFQGAFIAVGNSAQIVANGTQTFTLNSGARTIVLSGSGTLNWTTLGAVVGQAIELAGWTAYPNNNSNGFVIQSISTTTATNDTLTWTVGSLVDSPQSGAQTGGISVYVTGVQNSNSLWLCEASAAITVGTSPVTFTQLNGATDLSGGTGITVSGNQINATNVPNSSLANSSVLLGGQTLTLGAAATTTLTAMVSISSTTFVGALTGNASSATAVASGAANQLVYQTGVGATGFVTTQNYGVVTTGSTGTPAVTAGAAGVLQGSASAIPAWTTTPTLTGTNFTGIPNGGLTNSSVTIGSTAVSLGATVTTFAGLTSVTSTAFVGALTGNASSATSLSAGATGSLPYQSGAGTTAYLAAGTASQVLVGGASLPAWTNTPTLTGTNFTGIPGGAITTAVTTATNLGGTTTNSMPYQSASATTGYTNAANYGVVTTGSTGVPAIIAGAAGVLVGSTSAIPAWSTTPTLTGTNFTGIPNGGLTNSSVTIGSTAVSLGATVATFAGVTLTAPTFTGTTTHTGGKIMAAVAAAGYASINLAAAGLNPTTQVTGDLWVNGTTLYYYNGTTNINLSSGSAANLSGGGTNTVVYQSSAGTTAYLTASDYGTMVSSAAGLPSWTTPAAGVLYAANATTVPSYTTTPTLTGTNFSAIPNGALTNSSVTIGSTAVSLGATVTTFAGLTSVTSTTFVGALTGNASSATAVAAGTANQILYQSGVGVTAFATAGNYGVVTTGSTGTPIVTAGAAGVLQGAAASIPVWTTTPTLTGTNFSGIPWSALPTTGSPAFTITAAAKTSAYPVTANDDIILCDATSGAFSVTLLASPTAGMNFTIKKIDVSANAITIAGNGKNIDGAASQSVPAQWNSMTVVYNGTAWYIL
jgi:hypothetical protein